MKKIIISMFASLLLFASAFAADANDAIFAWIDGSSTCYQLSAMPKVTYSGTVAELRLAGSTTPELTLDLAGGKNLKITYGVYVAPATSVDDAQAEPVKVENRNGKFLISGKLIIVRNGHQYDVNGSLIK